MILAVVAVAATPLLRDLSSGVRQVRAVDQQLDASLLGGPSAAAAAGVTVEQRSVADSAELVPWAPTAAWQIETRRAGGEPVLRLVADALDQPQDERAVDEPAASGEGP